MGRLSFAIALLGLLAASTAVGAPSTEAVVSKPSLVCPQAELGNEDLQAQYERMWTQFAAEVDLATKALDSEIATRFTEAQKSGHLDLALMWDGMKRQFNQLAELRWDSAKEKKTWNQRFGNADFPDQLTALFKRCDQDYKSARERLEEGYRNIESALTKAGNLEQALKVRAELTTVLAGEPSPPTTPAKETESPVASTPQNLIQHRDRPGRTASGTINSAHAVPRNPVKPLLERMSGEWSHPTENLIRVIQANGDFLAVNKGSGGRVATGKIVPRSDEVAIVTLDTGWVIEMRLTVDGEAIACLFRNPQGQETGDGVVMLRLR
jgi:hypothetical protein